MTDFELAVNGRIKALLEEAKKNGINQSAIARDANILESKLTKIKKSEATANAEDIANLAHVLGVSTDYLLTGADYGERETVDLMQSADNYDLKVCLKSLFVFLLLSRMPIEEYGEGFWIDGNKFDEKNLTVLDARLQHTKGLDYYDDPHSSITFYDRDNPMEQYSEYRIWRTFLEQFDHIRQLDVLTNSAKIKLAEELIDSYTKAYKLSPFIWTGVFVEEQANNEKDDQTK